MDVFIFLLFAAAAIGAVTYIPVVGAYFSMFNTLIHESGHALAAAISGGRVTSISLFQSTEGAAAAHHHRFGMILTALSGYPFASIFAVCFLFLCANQWFISAAIMLLIVLSYNLLFWVRNIYGIFWIVSVLFLGYFIWYFNFLPFLNYLLTGIAFVLVTQSFLSCWHIFLLSVRRPKQAGDASILAKLTYIPAAVWGLLFLLQGSILFLTGCALWIDIDFYNYLSLDLLNTLERRVK
ncbi:M50 family metallopeptidase [Alteribacillus sp. HJP-4]|uniref:M50 family metallopeptidase n=1 Tax=Alteribacillus sp. HJP-4 TaxID=2775394 RepID=UPI0035CCCAAE